MASADRRAGSGAPGLVPIALLAPCLAALDLIVGGGGRADPAAVYRRHPLPATPRHKMIQTARAATRADVLILFPITSQPPAQDRFAVEIPEMEKRRASLDVRVRLWMTLDEYNQDIIGQSFYLEPELPLGRFSKAFFLPLMKEFIARRASTRGVNRRR